MNNHNLHVLDPTADLTEKLITAQGNIWLFSVMNIDANCWTKGAHYNIVQKH